MKPKICIIKANFYTDISSQLYAGAKKVLLLNNINHKLINVPGSFEIPIVISKYINKFDGFVVLGCIIKGKTPHFNFISNAITYSILNLSVKHKKPIGNGILTCLNKKQALERSNPKKKNKGGEAVVAALSVLKILKLNNAKT